MSWSDTTKADSQQLNADDLFSESITIIITKVKLDLESKQKAILYYEGDDGKPYKPCVSMRRVIEHKWGGGDETVFVGRGITLKRDPTVRFGTEEVGGIRITHMSDMSDDKRFMLTSSRGHKKPYKVEHLILKVDNLTPDEFTKLCAGLAKQATLQDINKYSTNKHVCNALNKATPEQSEAYNDAFNIKMGELRELEGG